MEETMPRKGVVAVLSALVALMPTFPARSASLSVLPISINVPQPATIGTITLRNHEARPLNAQVRVFRWRQVDGQDRLEPTEDVVASPPIVTISPGADYVVRLQRVASGEIASEEAYRTVIDELPNPNRQRNGSIAIVLRYLVPTFFLSPDASQPKLSWSIVRQGGATMLSAANNGDKRIQIVDLKLRTSAGRILIVGKGLAGYVLGHSTHVWTIPAKAGVADGDLVTADSDHGPIRATLLR
jgi:fimbrial chaperone protein